MSEQEGRGFTVIDRRGREEPKEVCRVCGAPEPHSKQYNQPTMDCIKYLRSQIGVAERLDAQRRSEISRLRKGTMSVEDVQARTAMDRQMEQEDIAK